jgi:RES domain-containing protein
MGPRDINAIAGPPPDLRGRNLPIRSVARQWIRLHLCRYRANHFGRGGDHRFDAPRKEYGLLYAGQDEACAFVEVFGDPLDVRLLSIRSLKQYCLSTIRATRPLRLVDLAGPGLRRLGADARVTSGDDYRVSQAWAFALWGHPDVPDGLLYRARHDPSKHAIAIFDRATRVTRTKRARRLTDDVAALGGLLDRYGFGLVDD